MNLCKSIQLVMSTIQYYQCKGAFLCIIPFKFITYKEPLEQNLCCHVSLLHKIVLPDETDEKCYILQKYLCDACYRDKVYTGHALDIEGFITIEDIIIGLAWWVPYIGQKQP